ncbi:lipid-binding SYLF domain-containing protein [Acetobacter sp.]|uniref:lipid-binding SYLF domain-containing protein n=1 Tax=Acetobacter sp. TaxID=440 RepID=UPI0039ECCEF2
MRSIYRFTSCSLALGVAATLLCTPQSAKAADSGQTLVDKAALTVQDMFVGATATSNVAVNLAKARAVMVCPSIFRMSIVFGGAGGGCVLLARDARGSWSDPAFYTLSTASFGIQLGVESSSAMFFVMTDRGLQALLDSQFQFGANAGVSFATLSSSVERGNAGARNTDILVAQKAQGLFAGAALGGTKLTVNSDINRKYYSQTVGPEEIVVTMRVNNPGADPLRSVLMRYSKLSGSTATPSRSSTTSASIPAADTVPDYQGTATTNAVQHESLAPLTPSTGKR